MRHGQATCYVNHGCRRNECRAAAHRQMKAYTVRRVAAGGSLTVPMFRATRRVQALQAMGYSVEMVAAEAGLKAGTLRNLNARKRMHLNTFLPLAQAYERLMMTPGPSLIARSKARGKNFAPPLAWENIDDPAARPIGVLQ